MRLWLGVRRMSRLPALFLSRHTKQHQAAIFKMLTILLTRIGLTTELTRALSGDSVRIESGPRSQDRYGRLLFYLYTQSGESIEATLIQEGLATAWTRDG